MTSSWKIAISVACIAVIAGAPVVWWVHREKTVKWKKLSEAASETRARAEEGDTKAQADLGHIHFHGEGVPQDYAEAVRWYRKAADQGDPRGQDGLAFMYYHGQGVGRDYAEALRWYRKSAEQGYAKAENGIALMYSQGQGVPQDYAESLRWYRKAADQGYAPAQYNLGDMYYYGRGVPRDRAEAQRWYLKAADQGDEYAQRALGLKGRGLSVIGTVTLTGLFLWCWRTLKESISPQRERQSRVLTIAGLCGLAYVSLTLYGAFGSFPSVLTLSAFHFAEALAAGMSVAMCISVFGPKRARMVLGISGILLMANDLPVIWRHELTRVVMTVRGFSSVNGLLIGMAVTLGIVLWLEKMKPAGHKQVTA
jgi:hypothetical protein